MADTINIDTRGVSVQELDAHVIKDDRGRPRLEPMPGTVSRWLTVLGRHVDRGPLRVAISRVTERRSHAQNRLLWGVIYPQIMEGLRELALEVGERCPFADSEDLHAAMKLRFVGATVQLFAGEEIEIPPTTTRLTVEQFSSYIKAITGWASMHGVYVELQESA